MDSIATLMQTGTMILGGLFVLGLVIVGIYFAARRATALKGS